MTVTVWSLIRGGDPSPSGVPLSRNDSGENRLATPNPAPAASSDAAPPEADPVAPAPPDVPGEENLSELADSEGFRLVEEIIGDAREIGRYEAARLIKIAELYHSEYMRPLPASAAAQSTARKSGRLVRDLEREDTTRAELVACLYLRDYEARRLISTALALTTR